MAWIESHQTLGRHPKVEKLAKILKIHKAQAIGHLHLLWWWCLDYAQDGSLISLTNSDIADAAGWTKQPDLFIEAMLTCGVTRDGFLERSGSGFVIHDWHQYAGRLIEKRRVDYERLKRFRGATKSSIDMRHETGHVTPIDTRSDARSDTPVDTRFNGVSMSVSDEVTNRTNQPTNQEIAAGAALPPSSRNSEKAAPVRPPPTSGAVTEFISAYRVRYPEDPTINTGTAVMLANLRKKDGEEKFRKILACFIADDDPFVVKNAHKGALLGTCLDRIRAKLNGSLSDSGKSGAPPALSPTDNEVRRRKALGLPLFESKGAAS